MPCMSRDGRGMDASVGSSPIRSVASRKWRAMSDERLARLLGGPDLAALRARLRARFERGDPRDDFTLSDLLPLERQTLEGLLGRAPRVARSMQLSHSELDRAIERAGLAADLRAAL